MAKKTTSSTKKAQYARYKAQNTYEKNRARKIKRHLKNHPNSADAKLALVSIKWRRRIPGNGGKA